jgi:geranylgeranyl diphosphate synthase type II
VSESAEERLKSAEELLDRLERTRAKLEETKDPDEAIEILSELAEIHRLKTGRLFYASIACALWVAEMPDRDQKPWREFAEELGMLFQVVDDILDGDGYVLTLGEEGARRLADEAAERARARLAAIDADTSVLEEIVAGLATRTA